jgi:hypothetical protein
MSLSHCGTPTRVRHRLSAIFLPFPRHLPGPEGRS